MAQRLLKRKPHKVTSGRARSPSTPPPTTGGHMSTHAAGRAVAPRPPSASAVLVGTYKAKQLAWIKRHGIYNYPVKDGDEFDEKSFAAIKELWLYADVKGTRHVFEAEFIGIKTREELISEYGYPNGNVLAAKSAKSAKNGRAGAPRTPHASRYYVFKTKYLEYGPRLDDPFVIARTADFGGRSAKVKKAIEQFKADGEFAPLEHYLPSDLSKVPRNRLRVCEAAVQLEFWANEAVCGYFSSQTVLSQTESVSISFQNDLGTLYLGDSLRWLKGLPSSSVDMIFADPPYSIGKADWDCFRSHEDYLAWCEVWVEQAARILKPTGTCYICGFSEILADVKYRTQHFFNGCRWIVWHYKNKANLGSDWGRSHESLLHFRKAKTTVLNVDDVRIPYNAHTLRYPAHPQADSSAYAKSRAAPTVAQWRPNEKGAKPKDVFDIPTTCNGMGEKTPHPTQKPEELVRKLVLASSNEGDLVLDPFSGSGTTAVVAQQLHRHWLACDKVPEYNQWAVQRLSHVPVYPAQYWIELDREVAKRRESIR